MPPHVVQEALPRRSRSPWRPLCCAEAQAPPRGARREIGRWHHAGRRRGGRIILHAGSRCSSDDGAKPIGRGDSLYPATDDVGGRTGCATAVVWCGSSSASRSSKDKREQLVLSQLPRRPCGRSSTALCRAARLRPAHGWRRRRHCVRTLSRTTLTAIVQWTSRLADELLRAIEAVRTGG